MRPGPRDTGRIHQRSPPNRAGEMATGHPIPSSGRAGGLEPDGAGDRETLDTLLEEWGGGAEGRRQEEKGLGTVWHWNHTLLRDRGWKHEAPLWLNLPICNWKWRPGAVAQWGSTCPAYWALSCIPAL